MSKPRIIELRFKLKGAALTYTPGGEDPLNRVVATIRTMTGGRFLGMSVSPGPEVLPSTATDRVRKYRLAFEVPPLVTRYLRTYRYNSWNPACDELGVGWELRRMGSYRIEVVHKSVWLP